jgi:hypothetical protein
MDDLLHILLTCVKCVDCPHISGQIMCHCKIYRKGKKMTYMWNRTM